MPCSPGHRLVSTVVPGVPRHPWWLMHHYRCPKFSDTISRDCCRWLLLLSAFFHTCHVLDGMSGFYLWCMPGQIQPDMGLPKVSRHSPTSHATHLVRECVW